jgi:biopolymer transport protein TolR
MSMSVGTGGGPKSEPNITPYIDILLVLLIIFMVITPVRQMDLTIKVPQNTADEFNGAIDPSVIVVSIDETSRITVNGDITNIGELQGKLQKIYSERSNKNMFVSASSKLPYCDVVRIIDIAKGAGVGDVGLVTEELR